MPGDQVSEPHLSGVVLFLLTDQKFMPAVERFIVGVSSCK